MSDPLTIIQGDALSSLPTLKGESVQCVVCSPPYWGLRDYGLEPLAWGNDNGCDHQWGAKLPGSNRGGSGTPTDKNNRGESYGRDAERGSFCECGAWRGCLGLEPTPDLYVAHLVQIFRELKRCLRNDGLLWLNIGDSYASQAGGYSDNGSRGVTAQISAKTQAAVLSHKKRKPPPGLKPKDLVGIPWMIAFALRADGWYLRSDIIWAKPNPMPESVSDRPTRSHEYLFLLSKNQRYYYDADAIAEPLRRPDEGERKTPARFGGADKWPEAQKQSRLHSGNEYLGTANGTRNKRSVWTVATQPFSEAHFATFPTELITPCILAGSRPAGKRCDCAEVIDTPLGSGGNEDPTMEIGRAGFNRPRKNGEGTRPITRGEQRAYAEQMKCSPYRAEMATEASTAFEHYIRTDRSGARPLPPALLSKWSANGWLTVPDPCNCPTSEADTVLDPFAGSGTTAKVAIELGRKAIAIEPKAEYVEMIERRCKTAIGLPLSM